MSDASLSRTKPAVSRLQRSLAAGWSSAWVVGIGAFVAVAINLSGELHRQDTDTQLMLTAVATYGLTWIDPAGVFHDEAFRRDQELVASPFDVWVIRPGDTPAFLLDPPQSRFDIPTLLTIATKVVAEERSLTESGTDSSGVAYRLHALPTYQDGRDEEAIAAVIVVGSPRMGEQAHGAFIQKLLLLATALGVLGVGVGVALARWSLRPMVATLLERERFVNAATHELRTPVASLRAVCESGLAGDEPARVTLSRVSSLVSRTEALVEHLLLYARLDAGSRRPEIEPLRLDLLVESVIPDDGTVALDLEECVVRSDPRLLEAAVRNLMENARLHGGRDVRMSVRDGRVVVEDSGSGFPAEVLASEGSPGLFLPSTKGIGLGLTVVRMIVELHSGTLTLENRVEGGARAILHLDPPAVS